MTKMSSDDNNNSQNKRFNKADNISTHRKAKIGY